MKYLLATFLIIIAVSVSVVSASAYCLDWNRTVGSHVQSGWAYSVDKRVGCETVTYYYAKGSDEELGTDPTVVVSLYSWGGGMYYVGECPIQDRDEDGYMETEDCDDWDADIHPGAVEICGDGIDQDCDGNGYCDTDADGDGFTDREGDCNDNDATIYPNAVDICEDGIDQDCKEGDAFCPLENGCMQYTSRVDEQEAAGRIYLSDMLPAGCDVMEEYTTTGTEEAITEYEGQRLYPYILVTVYTMDEGETYHWGECPVE